MTPEQRAERTRLLDTLVGAGMANGGVDYMRSPPSVAVEDDEDDKNDEEEEDDGDEGGEGGAPPSPEGSSEVGGTAGLAENATNVAIMLHAARLQHFPEGGLCELCEANGKAGGGSEEEEDFVKDLSHAVAIAKVINNLLTPL
jgi:hypothetical protein